MTTIEDYIEEKFGKTVDKMTDEEVNEVVKELNAEQLEKLEVSVKSKRKNSPRPSKKKQEQKDDLNKALLEGLNE